MTAKVCPYAIEHRFRCSKKNCIGCEMKLKYMEVINGMHRIPR